MNCILTCGRFDTSILYKGSQITKKKKKDKKKKKSVKILPPGPVRGARKHLDLQSSLYREGKGNEVKAEVESVADLY